MKPAFQNYPMSFQLYQISGPGIVLRRMELTATYVDTE